MPPIPIGSASHSIIQRCSGRPTDCGQRRLGVCDHRDLLGSAGVRIECRSQSDAELETCELHKFANRGEPSGTEVQLASDR
jgi:hypothetical protein